eukprot:TRINITY_DN3173_c0_g2_i1.p1 TRINITY_DN3173_c0_g2~~TRINITY_DN3173_c0_g2_i1.p1  ORF type:complete len:1363 (+),score=345.83 TRINITY_DN3173_c0_g2_i1:83-4171(+)
MEPRQVSAACKLEEEADQSSGLPIRVFFLLFLLSTCGVGFAGFYIMYSAGRDATEALSQDLARIVHRSFRTDLACFLQPFQDALATSHLTHLTADVHDWRNSSRFSGMDYAADWRSPPPPGDDDTPERLWRAPMEVRLMYHAQVPPMRQWMARNNYSKGVQLYAGFFTGDMIGIEIGTDFVTYITAIDDNPNHTAVFYVHSRVFKDDSCFNHSQSPCVHAWRGNLSVADRVFFPIGGRPIYTEDRAYHHSAIAMGRQGWLSPYIRLSIMEMVIPACSPLYRGNGEVRVVLCIDAPMAILKGHMRNLLREINQQLGTNATAFVWEGASGMLVETTLLSFDSVDVANIGRLNCGMNPTPCRRYVFNLTEGPGKFVGALSRAVTQAELDAARDFGSAVYVREVAGNTYFLGVGKVSDDYGLDWVLVVALPRSDMLRELNSRLLETVVICIALIIGSLLVDATVVYLVTQPLKSLSVAMVNAAALDFEQAASVRRSWLRELRNMQVSFHMLTELLQTYRGFLPHGLLADGDGVSVTEGLSQLQVEIPTTQGSFSTQETPNPLVRRPETGREDVRTLPPCTPDTDAFSSTSLDDTHGGVRRASSPTVPSQALRFVRARQAAGELGTWRARQATLLLAEHQFTQLLHKHEMPDAVDEEPADVLLNGFVTHALLGGKQHGAVILQVTATAAGISVLMSWNTHGCIPDHAVHACRCASTIVEQLFASKQSQQQWWSCAASTGRVFVGNLGTTDCRSPLVYGNPSAEVVALSRLALFVSSRAVVSVATFNRVQNSLQCRILDLVRFLRNPGEVEEVYRLITSADQDVPLAGDSSMNYINGVYALGRGHVAKAGWYFKTHLAGFPADPDAQRFARTVPALHGPYARRQLDDWDNDGPGGGGFPAGGEQEAYRKEQLRAEKMSTSSASSPLPEGRCVTGESSEAGLRTQIREAAQKAAEAAGASNSSVVAGGSEDLSVDIVDTKGRTWRRSERCLGKGVFGAVWLGMGTTGEMVAIKVISLPRVVSETESNMPTTAFASLPYPGRASGSSLTAHRQPSTARDNASTSSATAAPSSQKAESKVPCSEARVHPVDAKVQSTDAKGQSDTETFGSDRVPSMRLGASPVEQRTIGAASLGGTYMTSMLSTVGNQSLNALVREVTLLSSLRHDNVVCFTGSCVDDSNVYIVMEYVPGGSLAGMLAQFSNKLPPLTVKRYVYDILTGLDYLHSSKVIHQDLKPANVLVSIEGQCKLADFGASAVLTHAAAGEPTGPVGTPPYMAPEAAAGKGCTASDIWSLGILQLELLTGRLPWPPERLQDGMALVTSLAGADPPAPVLPADGEHPQDALDFARSCLVPDPEQRGTTQQLSAHPFLMD